MLSTTQTSAQLTAEISYLTTVILVPNIIKDFQSILVLKGSTGTGFFKFIFYWYEIFVIFLFPLLLAPTSISYFTDEEAVWWCVTPSYISHIGSRYWHSLMGSDWCDQTWCLSQYCVTLRNLETHRFQKNRVKACFRKQIITHGIVSRDVHPKQVGSSGQNKTSVLNSFP